VYLCSADKDLRQLLSDKVKILNLRKGESIDAAVLMADWGVRPEQVIDFQALVGDSVDNVPGVPGVGPKTAAKWLQQFGTLDNIIAKADEVPGGPKTKAALKEAVANGKLATSKKLVTLDVRVPLPLDWEGWKRRDWDGQRLQELFHEFGFRGFAERVRNTLLKSGAQKNAAALEAAGLASGGPTTAVAQGTPPSKGKERGSKKAAGSPGLFDAIDTIDGPPADAPAVGTPDGVRRLPQQAQEADADHLRPGDDEPRPDAGGAGRVRLRVAAGRGVLRRRPRPGRGQDARPGRGPGSAAAGV
jgi:DNA polymerase-1